MPLMEARGLAVGHAHKPFLFGGVNMAVNAGEIWCVLGPNGSGKTTLFRTLLGLLPAREGGVHLGGELVTRLDAPARARRAAHVPQIVASPFAFLVRDIVLMGRTAHLGLFASPGASDHAAAEAAMQALGIASLSERTFPTLSGGEQRLVFIARALVQDAPMLILDEPAAHLDIAQQAKILAIVRRLASGPRAVMFSTHDPAHALDTATHVVLVGDDRTLRYGPSRELMTSTNLAALYGTELLYLRDEHGSIAGFSARAPVENSARST